MNSFKRYTFSLLFLLSIINVGYAEGFLHTDGKNIVNGNGENVILRGIGTGNWMLMEGYMMKTEGVAGTQHEIRAKLEELMGEDKTDEFFKYWLENHFTKTDVDSMKAWGFNSVRVAMHYKWFTLPIEEEPIAGNNTLLFEGFKMIDDLLDWCEANQMYLILDLHGAPGGQGANADISDYDPSKPSLWESEENKAKTVFLWKELAKRYKDEEWIGGYDLINETNWTFPEGNNSQMRDLYGRITDAIREVDNNHIIFIEGNSFANDFSDLTPPWDNNMVYSFHKYWSGTGESDLDWVLPMREEHNVPLWLGESGENSNSWFTETIELCENNNIGWSWWPVKKNGINNVLNVPINKEYEDIVRYWRGEISAKPTPVQTFDAVMQWAENHKIENCKVQYDVIDAMIRQPHTDEVKPFRENMLNEPTFFSDFDFGKNGFAYSDNDVGHYGGNWSAWNTGWGVRNDGVDIETCNDQLDTTNGYNVGWTEDGEWMQYSMVSDSTAVYKLTVRHSSGFEGSKFQIVVNGATVTEELSLPGTGGWQSWQTTTFENVVIPAGNIKIKYIITQGGSNLSYFKFSEPKSAASIDFRAESGKTSYDGYEISLSLNKEITSENEKLLANEFAIKVDGRTIPVLEVFKDSTVSNVLILKHDTELFSVNEVAVLYNGTSVKSGAQQLIAFSDLLVQNNLPLTHAIPGQIEAEDFSVNSGFALEDCSDLGGGKNTSYASPADYLDYQVYVSRKGIYNLDYRVATQHTSAEILLQVGDGENFATIDTFTISGTGGWQNWETQSTSVSLDEGYYFIRIFVLSGEHNLNWFKFDFLTTSQLIEQNNDFDIYPNPVSSILKIHNMRNGNVELIISDIQGRILYDNSFMNSIDVDVSKFKKGMYFLRMKSDWGFYSKKIIVQ